MNTLWEDDDGAAGCMGGGSEEDFAQMDCAPQNVMDIIHTGSLIRVFPGNNLPKRGSDCLVAPDPRAHYRLS